MGCRIRSLRELCFAAMFAAIFTIAVTATPTHAQVRCNSSQNAAVQCFVSNALSTKLTVLRYGMNTSQFESYGVAISKILQDQQTYLVMLGMAGAVADAMPPTNADKSANLSAQQAAMSSVVNAALTYGLATMPASVTQQQLIWFSYDLVSNMDDNSGIMLSPGTLLRVVDSYIVTPRTGKPRERRGKRK